MKSYFAINHNPDAKDLKQLAQKTGLTKRVLQVRAGQNQFSLRVRVNPGLSPRWVCIFKTMNDTEEFVIYSENKNVFTQNHLQIKKKLKLNLF